MARTPIMLMSDNPLGCTGLGRVGGDLARLIATELPNTFRVGYAAFGGSTSHRLPYELYPLQPPNDGEHFLSAWRDFAGDETGILLTIVNSAWLRWLAFPEEMPDCELKTLLSSGKIKKWAYIPVDAVGPGDKLIQAEKEIIERMDRVLAYTSFSAGVIERTLGTETPSGVPHLPHGIDSTIFYPRSRQEARQSKFMERVLKAKGRLSEKTLLIGVVATNTPRKDWGLAFEIIARLKTRGVDVGLWAHTDHVEGFWRLDRLAEAFDAKAQTIITTGALSHEDMAWGYAACSATLGIGSEGWGLPLSESLACGVPVVTMNCAGATEFVPLEFRIEPIAWRWDGAFCCRRPVFRAGDWADKALEVREGLCRLKHKFTWDGAWPAWSLWLREGVE